LRDLGWRHARQIRLVGRSSNTEIRKRAATLGSDIFLDIREGTQRLDPPDLLECLIEKARGCAAT